MSVFPHQLVKGDKIGVIAPSSPLHAKEEIYFQDGLKFLEFQGLEVVLGDYLKSGDGKQKAADINNFFQDKNVRAIISLQGGDSVQDCLPYLDYNLVEANPKIFMGFSDISVLLNVLFSKAGLVTFHGPDVIWNLSKNRGGIMEKSFSGLFDNVSLFSDFSSYDVTFLNGHSFEGILIGGNLRCFLKLEKLDLLPSNHKSVLMIEDVNSTLDEIKDRFLLLKNKGYFKNLSGVMLGYFHNCDQENRQKRIYSAILDILHEYDLPVAVLKSFGHHRDNVILPIGARVKIVLYHS